MLALRAPCATHQVLRSELRDMRNAQQAKAGGKQKIDLACPFCCPLCASHQVLRSELRDMRNAQQARAGTWQCSRGAPYCVALRAQGHAQCAAGQGGQAAVQQRCTLVLRSELRDMGNAQQAKVGSSAGDAHIASLLSFPSHPPGASLRAERHVQRAAGQGGHGAVQHCAPLRAEGHAQRAAGKGGKNHTLLASYSSLPSNQVLRSELRDMRNAQQAKAGTCQVLRSELRNMRNPQQQAKAGRGQCRTDTPCCTANETSSCSSSLPLFCPLCATHQVLRSELRDMRNAQQAKAGGKQKIDLGNNFGGESASFIGKILRRIVERPE
ncbi:unnamed protein product [Closterium sp. Naga37s-1]|nr:unnamed protein product [Closterium sp. Naga37s-1]